MRKIPGPIAVCQLAVITMIDYVLINTTGCTVLKSLNRAHKFKNLVVAAFYLHSRYHTKLVSLFFYYLYSNKVY